MIFLLLALVAATPDQTPAPATRVLVSLAGLTGGESVLAVQAASERVAQVLPGYVVTSDQEIGAAMAQEAQRQLGACATESCLAEIAGALGARYVISLLVVSVDGAQSVSATLHDTVAVTVLGRSTRAGSSAAIAAADAAGDVAGALRPESSAPLVWGVVAGGAALVGVGLGVAGGVSLADATSREASLTRVTDPDDARLARAAIDGLWLQGTLLTAGAVVAGIGCVAAVVAAVTVE